MSSVLQTQKLDFLAIGAVLVMTALITLLVPGEHIVWAWVALGALTVILLWAHFSDPITLILIWFVTSACMSYFLWKKPVSMPGVGSLNVTVDRLFALVLFIVVILRLAVGRIAWRRLPGVVRLSFIMLFYFSVSLAISGFGSIADVSPHFRLIGGYFFPVLAMIVAFLAIRDEQQLKKFAWFFFLFGAYLTFTAWAEYFKVWSVVFPRYISNPEYGIHWGRARGPFLVSASLGITLVFCFYSNLYLAARQAAVGKIIIYLANVLMLPAIFFTLTRSVWLAMAVCFVIHMVYHRHLRSRGAVFALVAAVSVVMLAMHWSKLVTRDRAVGGVTDPYPIYARIGLAKISGELIWDSPFFGVGFGHFRDHASMASADPTSSHIRFASQQMEHNNFLSIMTETGVIGLLLYAAVLWMLFKSSLRVYRRLSPTGTGWITRDLVVLYWIMYANYIIDAMFRETSVDPFNNTLFFALSGVILAIDYMLQSGQALGPASHSDQQMLAD